MTFTPQRVKRVRTDLRAIEQKHPVGKDADRTTREGKGVKDAGTKQTERPNDNDR